MELDIFNPQVSTVAKGLEGKVILVYGGNNLGKTKQATRMKKPFYLPFEAGLNAIPGVPLCPITTWSDFIKINKLVGAGYCCYFIAHAQEKDGFISPKADKRALSPIINNTDLCVYVRSNGVDKDGKVVKSSGYLAQTDEFFARSRFDYLPTTYIEEFTAEALEDVIVKAIEIQEREEGITAVSFAEQKAQRTVAVKTYDDLMDELLKLGEKLADNGYLEDLQTIVANQLGEGKKASDLKKGQEQLIEAIIYDIESFIEENNL